VSAAGKSGRPATLKAILNRWRNTVPRYAPGAKVPTGIRPGEAASYNQFGLSTNKELPVYSGLILKRPLFLFVILFTSFLALEGIGLR